MSASVTPTSTVYGQPVTLSASVDAPSGSPSGSVSFREDGVEIGANSTVDRGAIRDTVIRFMEREVVPVMDDYEARKELPRDLVRKAGATGLFGWFRLLPWKDVRFTSIFIAMAFFIPGGAGGIIIIRASQIIYNQPERIDVSGSLVVLPGTFLDVSSELRDARTSRSCSPSAAIALIVSAVRSYSSPSRRAFCASSMLPRSCSYSTIWAEPRRSVRVITALPVPRNMVSPMISMMSASTMLLSRRAAAEPVERFTTTRLRPPIVVIRSVGFPLDAWK